MGNFQSNKNSESVGKNVCKVSGSDQISQILTEASALRCKVEEFNGKSSDNEYKYLDEMLTTFMIRLDDVDTGGKEEIRQARKAAVQEIQSCITLLESKAGVAT